MDAQLIEEMGFNPQPEAVNCFSEAQAVVAGLGADLRHQARLIVASGRVAILSKALYHCRSTDAVAGEYPFHLDVADTVAEANVIAARIEGQDDETRAEVLIPDSLKPAPVVHIVADDSGIPF